MTGKREKIKKMAGIFFKKMDKKGRNLRKWR